MLKNDFLTKESALKKELITRGMSCKVWQQRIPPWRGWTWDPCLLQVSWTGVRGFSSWPASGCSSHFLVKEMLSLERKGLQIFPPAYPSRSQALLPGPCLRSPSPTGSSAPPLSSSSHCVWIDSMHLKNLQQLPHSKDSCPQVSKLKSTWIKCPD